MYTAVTERRLIAMSTAGCRTASSVDLALRRHTTGSLTCALSVVILLCALSMACARNVQLADGATYSVQYDSDGYPVRRNNEWVAVLRAGGEMRFGGGTQQRVWSFRFAEKQPLKSVAVFDVTGPTVVEVIPRVELVIIAYTFDIESSPEDACAFLRDESREEWIFRFDFETPTGSKVSLYQPVRMTNSNKRAMLDFLKEREDAGQGSSGCRAQS